MVDEGLSFHERLKIELSDPLRYKLALRTAVACLAVEILIAFLDLPSGYWAILSAFLIIQLSAGATVRKATMRIVGTAAGCLVGFLAACPFAGHPMMTLCLLSVWALCLIYAGQRGIFPYGMLLGAITPFIVSFAGTASCGQVAQVAVIRFIEIGLGVFIAWVLVIHIWPVNEGLHLLSNTGKTVKNILDLSFRVVTQQSEGLTKIQREVRKSLERQDFLLKTIGSEGIREYNKEQIRALQAPLKSLYGHAIYLNTILRQASSSRTQKTPAAMSPFLDGFASFMEKFSHVSDTNVLDYLAGCRDIIDRLCVDLERERPSLLKNYVDQSHTDACPPERTVFLFYLSETLSELSAIAGENRAVVSPDIPNPRIKLSARLFPNGRIDGASIRVTIKVITAVLIASFLWMIPTGNVQATISAALVANQGKQTASYKKLAFRLLGTLLGGIGGIALVAAFQTIPAGFIVFIPCILFLCSYIGLGNEDWSYTGITAGLCFILCIGASGSEHNVFGTAAGRMEGVMLGGITAALVVKFLFPFDYRKRICELREHLALLYGKGITVIGRAFGSDHATANEIWRLRMEMRKSSVEYESIVHDAIWDRFAYLRKKKSISTEADRVRMLYRHFFSLFAVSRYLESRRIEPATKDTISRITGEITAFLEKSGLPPGDADSTVGIGTLDKAKQMISDMLKKIATQAGNDKPGSDEEGLFFLRILFHYLRNIVDELEHREWPY